MSLLTMEDKVILITGSSAGIGEAIALKFAELGCRVVIHGTNENRIEQVATRCEKLSPKQYKVSGTYRWFISRLTGGSATN